MKRIIVKPNGKTEEVDFTEGEVSELQASVPQEEKDALQLMQARSFEAEKRGAYAAEADPLFFKAQRGEGTMDEWLAKVAEIKARYADPA